VTEADRSPEQWQLYAYFSTRIQSLLIELLAAERIGAVQVDARAKDVQSFIEKVGRRPGSYLDPLVDITDLAAKSVGADFYVEGLLQARRAISSP
jgi:putative GTP pyrophosphokinase